MKKLVCFLLLVAMTATASANGQESELESGDLSYQEKYLVGDYPTWDLVLIGMGDEKTSEVHQDISDVEGENKHIGYSTALLVGLTQLAGGGAVGFLSAGMGPKFVKNQGKISGHKDVLESREEWLANRLSMELNETKNGLAFMTEFGEIKDVETDFFGRVQSFKTAYDYEFVKVDDEEMSFYFESQGPDGEIRLFILPRMGSH
ncbi:MAG: hypothetical protein CL677_06025 [Bdellovibrionaceae bacterium]|nr:hypothetical protein [Pseudobdellovibrionaceae bacterium]|tara:strand:+ start:154399 stop:155010 length:612 start_codon:yes stop_codon:yes gene_type:complete